nr:hypothetical protein CFP56_25431 [Quercus suber]
MRIWVKLDPWFPLIACFILKRDDGQYTWVECRYKRVFKIYKRCGIIGHARSQCHMDMFDIEELLRDQAYRIRVQYPLEFALDLMEVMYTNDIRAFRRHPSHRITRVRYNADSNPSPRGWTNADIITTLVDNPEAYEDSSEPRWHGHSHFHVGESSGTANDLNDIQITTGILTRREQAGPQKNTWNQEIPNWQTTHTRMQHLESKLYDIHSTQHYHGLNPMTNPLLGNQTRFAIEDTTPSRTTLMEGFVPLATQADISSKPTSPKRQCDEDDGETRRVNRRRLNQEQGILSNNNHNLNGEADPITTSLHNIKFENNEFILRLRITGQSDQVQETEVIWGRQNAEIEHQQNIITNLIQLLANIRLSKAA